MMPAILAGIGPALGDLVELGFRAAAGTSRLRAVFQFHDLVQAGVVVREVFLEIFDGVTHG